MFKEEANQLIAAVDLGSNSFHMVIAKIIGGSPVPVCRKRVVVRLLKDMGDDNLMTRAAMVRAMDAIDEFAQIFSSYPITHAKIVGTAAMRRAANASELLAYVQKKLHPNASIIDGSTEAELIYFGVTRALPEQTRLVVDIGGGSTEFIIGKGAHVHKCVSLPIGCVTFQQAHFPSGRITREAFESCEDEASDVLQQINESFIKVGWEEAWGSSGAMSSLNSVMQANDLGTEVNQEVCEKIKDMLIDIGTVEQCDLPGLKLDRKTIFPSGVGIMLTIIKMLNIQSMQYSPTALREGLLYKLMD